MGHGEAYVFGGVYRRLRQKDLPSKTLSGTVYLGGTAHRTGRRPTRPGSAEAKVRELGVDWRPECEP